MSGFSILEILIVVVVMGIVLLLGIPWTIKYLVRLRIETYASQARTVIFATRGRAIRDNVGREVGWTDTTGDGTLDSLTGWTGVGAGVSQSAVLQLDRHGLAIYNAVDCFDLDGDNVPDREAGPMTYDGTGTAEELVAFCFEDVAGNVMRVHVDSPSGMPKISKFVPGTGFTDESWEWEWY